MIKLIIFDFDGVIITGSNDAYFYCYHKALEFVGVKFSPELERSRILELWGKGHVVQLEYLLQEHSDKISEAVKEFERVYDESFENNLRLIDGAKEALVKLKDNYKLSIVSGAQRKLITDILNKNNLNFFEDIISSYDIEDPEKRKPAGYAVDVLLNKYSLSQNEAVVVGDGESDLKMAINAKVTPIAVLTGNLSKEDVEKLGVKYVISSIKELAELLKNLT